MDKKVEAVKNPTMTFPNLSGNKHVLRILGQDGLVACELVFERDVFGWNKEQKVCDNSRIRLEVRKPTTGEETKLVKEFRICTNSESHRIWMGDVILGGAEANKVESV